MLAAGDSVTVWHPPQMCRMCSAAEDKELSVSTLNCSRYDQTDLTWQFLGIWCSQPSAKWNTLNMRFVSQKLLPQGSSVSWSWGPPKSWTIIWAGLCHKPIPPLLNTTDILRESLQPQPQRTQGFRWVPALLETPQIPCSAFNPDVMFKRPGTVGLSFQFMSQDHCMYGCAVLSENTAWPALPSLQ